MSNHYNKKEKHIIFIISALLEGVSYGGIIKYLQSKGIDVCEEKIVKIDNELQHLSGFITNN